MNQDAPCHNRYGKIGSLFFLQVLTKCGQCMELSRCVAERKGKTWQGVQCKSQAGLLIAYLKRNLNAIELASIFVASMSTRAKSLRLLENKGKRFVPH